MKEEIIKTEPTTKPLISEPTKPTLPSEKPNKPVISNPKPEKPILTDNLIN